MADEDDGAPLVHSSSSSPSPSDELTKDSPPSPRSMPVPEGSYSPFVAYCVTVNYILGVGVIGMPKAFNTGGWLLSTFTLLLVSVMATFTALWYVEVGHRAARREKAEQEGHLAALPLDPSSSSSSSVSPPDSPSSHPLSAVKEPRRIEANELIAMFLSPGLGRLYEVLMCVYMMGSLWSYTSVFSTGMAANLGVPFLNGGETCVVSGDRSSACYGVYLFYNAVFACIVIPIATRNLTEMKAFVVALAMLRFVAITCMVVTTIEMLYRFPAVFDGKAFSAATSAPFYSDAPAVNWGGLGVIFPVCIFAQVRTGPNGC